MRPGYPEKLRQWSTTCNAENLRPQRPVHQIWSSPMNPRRQLPPSIYPPSMLPCRRIKCRLIEISPAPTVPGVFHAMGCLSGIPELVENACVRPLVASSEFRFRRFLRISRASPRLLRRRAVAPGVTNRPIMSGVSSITEHRGENLSLADPLAADCTLGACCDGQA
jgi:hypothetical protein